ncbi:hypothetical protein LIER_37554 [Lithospermum erythrorhizon]|uniref:Reverse transcriptase domain-containing protein n=1 Tax=Lithospermum erythrorhizon TaxID=34254 RepID=A0AAV3PS62_LITER
MRSHHRHNKILTISDGNGMLLSKQEDIVKEAVGFYVELFRDSKPKLTQEECEFISQCIDKGLDSQQQVALCVPVQEEEIRKTLFSMAEHKAPGPDGFLVEFFKENWNVVGVDFMKAVREFFVTCFMPKTVNATSLSLIPKKQCTTTMRDYRSIACCNVLYKCITKIMATRLKRCLSSVISGNQSAFMEGRLLSDNVLLMQEMVCNYHVPGGVKRCAIKIDLMKAYDSVKWEFL